MPVNNSLLSFFPVQDDKNKIAVIIEISFMRGGLGVKSLKIEESKRPLGGKELR